MQLLRFMVPKTHVYSTHFKLYVYNDINCRLVKLNAQREKGYEEIRKKKKISNYIEKDDAEINRVSISRTKRNIREIALSNNFEYFATITVNSKNADRFSLDECQELLRKKFKKLKRINKNFAYIFITEKHKDGAFHFHGLIKRSRGLLYKY